MDAGGYEIQKVVTITQGTSEYDMFSARNGILWVGDDVFFAGMSKDYETKLR